MRLNTARKAGQADGELESLADRAHTVLRDRIVSLEFPPGSLLSENTLSDRLGISRTPVREALKRLEREYLVKVLPQRGIFVTPADLQDQVLLLEIRRGLEGPHFARAAQRSTAEQRARFHELADRLAHHTSNNDLLGHYGDDKEFDELIDVCAGNRFISEILEPVHYLVRRFWQLHRGTDASKRVLELHLEVARAVASGSPERVLACSETLLDFNRDFFRSLVG